VVRGQPFAPAARFPARRGFAPARRFPPLLLAALPCALLAACVVGPNYRGPPPVAPDSLAKPAFVRQGGPSVDTAPPVARWWVAIGDPRLTQLIDDALAASPTLQSAEARVRAARAQVLFASSKYLPSGGVDAAYLRARIPTSGIANTAGSAGSGSAGAGSSIPNPLSVDVYNASFDAAWEIDLFGATRRALENARASSESAQAALEDAQVQLAAQVAEAYVDLRAAQDHVALTERTLELRAKSVSLTEQRVGRGTSAQGDLERLQGERQDAAAQLPTEQAQVEQQLDQLALLTGRDPGSLDSMLSVDMAVVVPQPSPPAEVPIGSPADWLRRRPDIREAERTLAARTATIGADMAAYFPSVSLLGLFGNSASAPSGLGRGTPLSLLSPGISWSFLSIPRTRATVRGAEADRDQALADYRQTVLQALLDANRSLERFGRSQQALREWQAARDSADHAARLTRERFTAGTASLIDELDTERQRTSAEDQLVTARADLMTAYVSLQKSLGLGWGAR
jgi:NodT family efflux transporter outer membrane factor (OMF) lipoprotein